MVSKKILLQIICIVWSMGAIAQNPATTLDPMGQPSNFIMNQNNPLENPIESTPLQPCIIDTISAYSTGASTLTFDGTYFWLGSFPGKINKILPNGTLVKTLDISFDRPYGIAEIDGYLWVTDNSNDLIHKLDSATGVSLKSFPTPFTQFPTGLAWDGSYLWHISTPDQNITKIDTGSGIAVDTIDLSILPLPSSISFQGPNVWIGENSQHEFYRLDTVNFNIQHTITAPNLFANGSAMVGPDLWVTCNPGGNDSIFQIDLNCTLCGPTPLISNIAVTACGSYTTPSGNASYNTSGIYQDTLLSVGKCDSLLIIDLTINQISTNTLLVNSCEPYISPNGNVLDSTGIYIDTLTNVFGCDSLMVIDLTIEAPTSSIVDVNACDSYESPSGNHIWTVSGTYQDTIQNTAGCDSVMTINLAIDTIDTGVTPLNATLTADLTGANYQWLDCENGFAPVAGETNQSFTPVINGNYAVVITQNGCADTSDCFTVSTVGLEKSLLGSSISIYPNPTERSFLISLERAFSELEISVRTIEGKLVKQFSVTNQQQIDIELTSAKGVYLVEISHPLGRAVLKVVKW